MFEEITIQPMHPQGRITVGAPTTKYCILASLTIWNYAML